MDVNFSETMLMAMFL